MRKLSPVLVFVNEVLIVIPVVSHEGLCHRIRRRLIKFYSQSGDNDEISERRHLYNNVIHM